MKKTKYLALNIQKEISIKYYKADTEETVNKLFFKEYGKYPQKIINVNECAIVCGVVLASVVGAVAIEELIKSGLKKENNNLKIENTNLKIENHNINVENNNLKIENETLNNKFNKAISDGTKKRSSQCARYLREKRTA